MQHIVELRHDLPSVPVEDTRPAQVSEPIGQSLRPRQVTHADEDVVDLRVLDTAGRQLAGQPLVPLR
jgi:hypothetical protein